MATSSSELDLTQLEFELLRGESGLGFNIRGGVDIPHIPGHTGIFVTKIREKGAAALDGRLQEGDRILEINGKSVSGVTHNEAVSYFVNAGPSVKLKILQGAERAILERKDNNGELAEKPTLQQNNDSSFTVLVLVASVIAVGAIVFIGYSKLRK